MPMNRFARPTELIRGSTLAGVEFMRTRSETAERIDAHMGDESAEYAAEAADVVFYRDLIDTLAPASVLELGCGSGRVTVPLAEQAVRGGYTIVGLDLSSDLLACAQQRLLAEPESIRSRTCLLQGDMRQYRCPGTFDLAIMPLGALSRLLRLQDQLDVWWHMYESLRPEGCFVVDATAREFPADVHSGRHPTRRLFDDRIEAQELELLFRASGFEIEAMFDGYHSRPLQLGSRGCVVIGRKGASDVH
jgi:SAM-dependent methyltransferase